MVLNEKAVSVTGGASGIGLSALKPYIEKGVKVVGGGCIVQ